MNPLNIPNKFLNNFTALTRIINRFTGISQPLSCFPLAGWLPTVLIISSVRINLSGEDALRRPVLRNRILVSYVLLPVEGSESVSSMKYLSDTCKLIKRIFQTTLLFLPVLSALQSFLLLLRLRSRSLSELT